MVYKLLILHSNILDNAIVNLKSLETLIVILNYE